MNTARIFGPYVRKFQYRAELGKIDFWNRDKYFYFHMIFVEVLWINFSLKYNIMEHRNVKILELYVYIFAI